MSRAEIRIGIAGWTIPASLRAAAPDLRSHLELYAERFTAVEINSSFYRPHRRTTYERWAQMVPPQFKFSVKVPKLITHTNRLIDSERDADAFLGQVTGLGEKLETLLVQLPPSLMFDSVSATDFFSYLGSRVNACIVCEPRHPSWFEEPARDWWERLALERAAADPPRLVAASVPGGNLSLVYYRLHGSPRMYYSSYETPFLRARADDAIAHAILGRRVWCVFDNTAAHAAWSNALEMKTQLAAAP